MNDYGRRHNTQLNVGAVGLPGVPNSVIHMSPAEPIEPVMFSTQLVRIGVKQVDFPSTAKIGEVSRRLRVRVVIGAGIAEIGRARLQPGPREGDTRGGGRVQGLRSPGRYKVGATPSATGRRQVFEIHGQPQVAATTAAIPAATATATVIPAAIATLAQGTRSSTGHSAGRSTAAACSSRSGAPARAAGSVAESAIAPVAAGIATGPARAWGTEPTFPAATTASRNDRRVARYRSRYAHPMHRHRRRRNGSSPRR